MKIHLARTFSSKPDTDGEVDWSNYLGSGTGKLTWSDLLDQPLVVVVGQAGIGKTIEFELEAERLCRAGKPAFFVALNQLVDSESWDRVLVSSYARYEQWKGSTETAFFLLDAVDEARLTDPAAFERALSVVSMVLRDCMSRASFVISSRPTDWSIDEVSNAVDKYLGRPIGAALRAVEEMPVAAVGAHDLTVNTAELPAAHIIEPFVVSLDPLSILEAKRLAGEFGVLDGDAFWGAVSDGGYTFMATRPLDLEWMVSLWNVKRSLGTYLELIEVNIENRLIEQNQSYVIAGAVLSVDRMREGAEVLAAATELSGRAYIATGSSPNLKLDEVMPTVVLSGWKQNEVSRLLSAAVFDEATFGRVRFHHRTARAYLAACWVNRQLEIGVPFYRVLTLFASSPYGTTVLIPNRRWVLCWLAAINAATREWVSRYFPEMLLFDGDPESWDSLSVDRAFMDYVQRLRDGLNTDWYNQESEIRRVGRRLSRGVVAHLLSTTDLPARITTRLLPIAKYGHLKDCAEAVFRIYRNADAGHRERSYALDVLETIATPEQRVAIKDDLISGLHTHNAIIASALPVIHWHELSVEQLVAIFGMTESEEDYGGGPMARAVKHELLPTATAASAEMLLRAVLKALPRREKGKQFARYPESDQPKRAWLLYVLPDCFDRLVKLLPRNQSNYPSPCVEAAEQLEALHITGFINGEKYRRLHAVVAEYPRLRWQIALGIALSEDVSHSTSRLTWGNNCLVNFSAADVPELVARANDITASHELRDIWFKVGMEVTFRGLKGRARTDALAALSSGADGEARRSHIAVQRARWMESLKVQRQWKLDEATRRRKSQAQHEANRDQLTSNIECIRDASHKGTLHWLMTYSYERAGERKSLTRIDYQVIARDFGQCVADALSAGLKLAWVDANTPNPADYRDGRLPWEALTALAGLHTLLEEGFDIASLPDADAGRAAKLAVWELNGPPEWFDVLAKTHSPAVSRALRPWIEADAQISSGAHQMRRTLEMVLRCPAEVRGDLLAPLLQMATDGHIAHPETLRDVVRALSASGIFRAGVLADICRARVAASISEQGLLGDEYWLCTWLEDDCPSAWTWFERHVESYPKVAGDLVKAFAKLAQGCNWIKLPADAASTEVLLRLHRLLTQHQPMPGVPVDPDDMGKFGHVISELRSNISNLLVKSRGAVAHRALVHLMETETEINAKQWLAAQVMEHAATEASLSSMIEPRGLSNLATPFATPPQSEAQLFEHAVARLEDVRKSTEEGRVPPVSVQELGHDAR